MTGSVVERSSVRLNLRTRIALLAGLAVGIAIAVTTVALFFVVRNQVYDQFNAEVLRQARLFSQGDPSAGQDLPMEALNNPKAGLLTANNTMLSPWTGVSTPPGSTEALAVAQGTLEYAVRTMEIDGESFGVAAVPAQPLVVDGQPVSTAFILALPTDPVDKTLHELTLVLLLIGLVGVVGAAGAGYAVARTGLRPVADLTAAAERVARTEDLTPIDVRSDDEIGRLSQAFNTMLSSLDAARQRERRLVADAGHELRTPLTSIRTNLDLLAQAQASGVELSPQDKSALLSDVSEQIRELGDLVGDLMQLSQGITGSNPVETIEMSGVVSRSIERVQRRAPTLTFVTDVDPWWVTGDPAALERAVTNLLDNAAKWSPSEGEVHVLLKHGDLTVTDDGPGIPEAERSKVFERFYRAEDSRGLPGSGLGLAIVAQTAQQHGGKVMATTAESGGAQLILRLPGTPETPSEAE